MNAPEGEELAHLNEKVRRSWAKQASFYDKSIGFFERRLFGNHRPWACSQATGDVLEVAIGTGLNLSYYPEDAQVTGVDLTAEMLSIARCRAKDLGRNVDLHEGDAHNLDFPDASFDSVVCTYSLCGIPDPRRALSEMHRVLRPGGKLILVDHIRGSVRPVLWFQRFIEFFSIRLAGEHMTRRPLEYVEAMKFELRERDRLGPAGIVERIVAVKSP